MDKQAKLCAPVAESLQSEVKTPAVGTTERRGPKFRVSSF